MAIRLHTKTLHFVDPETGEEDPEATFTIRRLSHEGQLKYLTSIAELHVTDAGEVVPDMSKLNLELVTTTLLHYGLVRLSGLLYEDGTPVTVDRVRDADNEVVAQIVQAIQTLNVPPAAEPKTTPPDPTTPSASAAVELSAAA
jgi:hypothetical protein